MKSLFFLLFFSTSVFAADDPPAPSINYSNNYSDGTALALAASSLQFDQNVDGWQVGMGTGYYQSSFGHESYGTTLGLGKRMCLSGRCGVLNFSAGLIEGGGFGGNMGFTWKL